MHPPDFIARLRCPLSHQPLRLLDDRAVDELNRKIAASDPRQTLEGGLATPDAAIVYPIRNGVICMLSNLAIRRMGQAGAGPADRVSMISDEVRRFYDEVGWKKRDSVFSDAAIFEDLRPVVATYVHDCHLRLAQHLNASGTYLLDVASGPIQYDEYLAYSAGYQRRVCVDISVAALIEARKKLAHKGLYVLADMADLPFVDDSFDGVVSLHTVYHIPESDQEKAFNEVFRVLAPGGRAAVVYSWGRHSPLTLAFVLPVLAWRWFARRIRRWLGLMAHDTNSRSLYSHHHPYRWFASRHWAFAYELYPWRSVGVDFTKLYIHDRLFGRAILRWLFGLEDRWPRLFGIVGQYPTIVIAKPSRADEGTSPPPRPGHG